MQKLLGVTLLCFFFTLKSTGEEDALTGPPATSSQPTMTATFLTGCLTGGTQAFLENRTDQRTLLSVPLLAGIGFYLYKKASEEPVDYLLLRLCCYLLGHKLGNWKFYKT